MVPSDSDIPGLEGIIASLSVFSTSGNCELSIDTQPQYCLKESTNSNRKSDPPIDALLPIELVNIQGTLGFEIGFHVLHRGIVSGNPRLKHTMLDTVSADAGACSPSLQS